MADPGGGGAESAAVPPFFGRLLFLSAFFFFFLVNPGGRSGRRMVPLHSNVINGKKISGEKKCVGAIVDFDQMWFIFQHNLPRAVHTLLPSVLQCLDSQWRIQGGGGGRIGRGPPFFGRLLFLSGVFFFFLVTPEVGLVGGWYPYTVM